MAKLIGGIRFSVFGRMTSLKYLVKFKPESQTRFSGTKNVANTTRPSVSFNAWSNEAYRLL
jgi:hypothetical protein